MQYSKYYSAILKDSGQPTLTKPYLKRMLNVISLEGTINGLLMAKEIDDSKLLDSKIEIKRTELLEMTKNMPPEEFLYKMVLASKGK